MPDTQDSKSDEQPRIKGWVVVLALVVILGLWFLFMAIQGVWPPWEPH